MKSTRRHLLGLFAAAALVAVGCNQADPPKFRLNMVKMASSALSNESQAEIANVLDGLFGTPDKPFALPETGFNQLRLELAAGPAWTSEQGVNRGLYRRHCVHCHGISGDGRGPTARFLNPYPRDYRQGLFKFKSTFNPDKPTDEDLHRVLHNGIPGTSMPSFSLLPQSEREALIEYVKYLAVRGEMEQRLADYVASELGEVEAEDAEGNPVLEDGQPKIEHLALDPAADSEQATVIKELLEETLAPWREAPEKVISPEEDQIPADDRSPEEIAASIAAGRALFMDPQKGNCFSCHGPTALGDGQQTDYDNWMKEQKALVDRIPDVQKELETARDAEEPNDADIERLENQLADLEEVEESLFPLRNAVPRNLRKGIYRGGRRRLDIYWRVHAGIPGTPMPAAGGAAPGAAGPLSGEQIWNVVDYVLSLPYEAASQPTAAGSVEVGAVTR